MEKDKRDEPQPKNTKGEAAPAEAEQPEQPEPGYTNAKASRLAEGVDPAHAPSQQSKK